MEDEGWPDTSVHSSLFLGDHRAAMECVGRGPHLVFEWTVTTGRCTVYVLKSTIDRTRYYVGSTRDVQARIAAHNAGVCSHTRKYRPWQLHVRIEFSDEERAAAFEKYLKSGSGPAFAKRHF